ncbi:hypothetical protein FGO68_gene6721 [Halteria grandinella]|uniref:Uncharacterized protein n=1 Tax=Halteria grandinella TaxID=5974 RepID=A0A8J8NQD3_HALGN|nr:hypothetical protein FGO68_gene6721 [Halteria grandinella]
MSEQLNAKLTSIDKTGAITSLFLRHSEIPCASHFKFLLPDSEYWTVQSGNRLLSLQISRESQVGSFNHGTPSSALAPCIQSATVPTSRSLVRKQQTRIMHPLTSQSLIILIISFAGPSGHFLRTSYSNSAISLRVSSPFCEKIFLIAILVCQVCYSSSLTTKLAMFTITFSILSQLGDSLHTVVLVASMFLESNFSINIQYTSPFSSWVRVLHSARSRIKQSA